MARVYLHIADRPPQGVRAFRRTLAFVARNRSPWVGLAAGRRDWSDIATRGKTEDFPLATALFSLPSGGGIPLQRTLAWLILELRLTGWSDEETEPVCSWLRGLSSDKKSNKLRDAIGDCDGLRSLRERVAYLRTISCDPEVITGHGDFDLAWTEWLAAVVSRLLRPLETTAEGDELRPRPLDGPAADPPDPLLEDPSEPDLVSGWELDVVEEAGERHGLKNRLAAAIGKEIHRRSSPELLRDPDNILPRPVARQAWEHTAGLIQAGLDANDLPLAEQGLDHLLGIEVGLSRVEAEATAFGDGEAVAGPIIDLKVGALRRPESRPRGAYSPKPEAISFWQSTGGDILFPLSPTAISLSRRLLDHRAKSESQQDTGLLLSEVVSPKDRKAWLASTEVRQTLGVFEPTRSGTRPAYRLRIAAELAGTIGQDATQIAFGDTFGASPAPTYYGAFRAETLAYHAALANVGLQGPGFPKGAKADAEETGARAASTLLSSELRAQCTHMVGSRVRSHREAFEGAWVAVGVSSKPGRGRPKVMRDVDDWRRQRDSLALHLMLATGHRPFMALGAIHLTDFLPTKAMALIRDKRSDPARLTRLVGTGWRFMGALASLVEELRRLAKDLQATAAARDLARKILRGAEPVFSLPAPNGSVEPLDVGELLARLPAVWAERPNLHRHALDQALIRAGVDPEHRYFQMGWLEGEVHAVSDMAPYPPEVLGSILAGPIDEWLESVGWLGGHNPKDPQSILADIPLRDFDQAAQEHRASFERRIHELKRALNERRREITPVVQKELIEGLGRLPTSAVLVPYLSKGDRGELRLRLKDPNAERPRITPDMVDVVLARLRSPRYEPVHAYLGARILSSALLWACKRKQCFASLPPLQHPSFKSVPSPFVPGLGLASAIADALRAALVVAASNTRASKDGAIWRAHLAIWAILAHTPYRSLKEAQVIALGIGKATHSKANGWLLRVPLGDGHVPITGPAAPLLHRLGQLAGWQDLVERVCGEGSAELGRFLKAFMPERMPSGISDTQLRDWMIATLRTAGAAELTGPERLVMNGVVQPASVRADRIAAAEDGASLPGPESPDALSDLSSDKERSRRSAASPDSAGDEKVRRLMRCFHADYRGDIAGAPALPPKGRIKQLLPEVKRVLGELGRKPTLPRMTLGYVKQLMVTGGPRSKGGMRLRTIYRIYHCIAPSLAAVPATVDLRDVEEEALTNALLASIVLSKNKDKPDVLDEVRRFLEFVENDHDIATPNWDLVYLSAGEAIRGKDPAIVTDAEVNDILRELAEDVSPKAMDGKSPVERRERELSFGSALLLEASNARPQSIYGLTLADIHVGPDGDFIQLRSAGKYAEVKTRTSAGFIPLEGEVWQSHRAWFVEWIQGLRRYRPEEDWIHIPLFATLDGPLGDRYPRRVFLDRLGELIRWRTRQSRGRTYWLRKRGVRNRHDRVRRARAPRARDVYRVLKVCGHATIATPIASYIGDPSAWMELDRPVIAAAERGAASALSGLPVATLDQRWQRWRHARNTSDGPDERTRLALTLHMPDTEWPSEELPDPPPYKSTVTGFPLWAVESVMNALAMGYDPQEVVDIVDVDVGTAKAIHARCQELTLRTRRILSKDDLSRPRRTPAYLDLMALLDRKPQGLGDMAKEWAHCARITVPRGSVALIEPEAVARLRALAEMIGYELGSRSTEGGDVGHYLGKRGEGIYGSEPVLEWVLAVLWVAAGLAVCRDLRLTD